jgi:predicted ATPase
MLVAISGVQGSGKTTVLNGLKNLGYNVIERKTSRSILADWNFTLEEVYGDQELCKRFQTELLARKQQDELFAVTSSELWFTERSFADVFTYALISLGHFNKHSQWLDQYYIDCTEANSKYLGVFFLNALRHVPIQNDGVRGINQHYVKQVDMLVRRASEQMARKDSDHFYADVNPLVEVQYDVAEQRVRFVAEHANQLWLTERLHVDQNYTLTQTHPQTIESRERMKKYTGSITCSTPPQILNENI